jgi:hypothetical protein
MVNFSIPLTNALLLTASAASSAGRADRAARTAPRRSHRRRAWMIEWDQGALEYKRLA